jgi:pyruvate formate lyase activating enzyme
MDHHEAMHWRGAEGGKVRCGLCPHRCLIAEGREGLCKVRRNDGGTLVTLSYGNTVTVAVDPIEKKPLYHFYPGSAILSVGPNGCTLTCDHCQNWHISQERVPVRYIAPDELVSLAGGGDSIGAAFTYTEPLIWFEYLLDVCPLLHAAGLKAVLVTNGYLEEGPAREIVGQIDACNVDLKSFDDRFYRKHCGGNIEPVKRFIEIAAGAGTHVEVTCLVIPELNDTPDEISRMARWLAAVGRDIPLHLSRFFPHYRMSDRPPTPQATLEKVYEAAREFLDYVYIGNIFIEGTEDTRCPACGGTVVERSGYAVRMRGKGGTCPECGVSIKGVWK